MTTIFYQTYKILAQKSYQIVKNLQHLGGYAQTPCCYVYNPLLNFLDPPLPGMHPALTDGVTVRNDQLST